MHTRSVAIFAQAISTGTISLELREAGNLGSFMTFVELDQVSFPTLHQLLDSDVLPEVPGGPSCRSVILHVSRSKLEKCLATTTWASGLEAERALAVILQDAGLSVSLQTEGSRSKHRVAVVVTSERSASEDWDDSREGWMNSTQKIAQSQLNKNFSRNNVGKVNSKPLPQ